jgi:hypothetical protein
MKKNILSIIASIGLVFILIHVLPCIAYGFNKPLLLNTKIHSKGFLPIILLIFSFLVLKKLTKRYKNTVNLHIISSWVLVIMSYMLIYLIDKYITKDFSLTYFLLDVLGWNFNPRHSEFESRMRGKVFLLIPCLYIFYSLTFFLGYRVYKFLSLKKIKT